jgi:hypothetical protein
VFLQSQSPTLGKSCDYSIEKSCKGFKRPADILSKWCVLSVLSPILIKDGRPLRVRKQAQHSPRAVKCGFFTESRVQFGANNKLRRKSGLCLHQLAKPLWRRCASSRRGRSIGGHSFPIPWRIEDTVETSYKIVKQPRDLALRLTTVKRRLGSADSGMSSFDLVT